MTDGRSARRLGVAGAMAALVFAIVPAAATASDGETALRSWLGDLDAAHQWSARFSLIESERGGRKITLRNLTIASFPAGLTISAPEVVLEGGVRLDDGALRAGSVRVDQLTLTTDGLEVEIEGLVADGGRLPALTGYVWNPDKPFTTIGRTYGLLAGMAADSLRIARVGLTESADGIESLIGYGDIAVERWHQGEIASMSVGPTRMETPNPGGLIRFSVGGLEVFDIDLDAFAHSLDPARYEGGRGDGVWRRAVGRTRYDGVAIDAPDIAVTVADVTVEAMRLRQSDRSFAAFLDAAAARPELLDDEPEVIGRTYDGLSTVAIGRLVVEDIDVEARGIDGLRLARFALADASSERLGEMVFEDFAAAVPGEGFFEVDRFALGRLVLPSGDEVRRAIATEALNGLTGQLGFLEIAGLDFQSYNQPRTKLDRFRLDMRDYVGRIPSFVNLEMEGLQLGANLVADRQVRAYLDELGYDRIDADLAMRVTWDAEQRTVAVDGFRFAMRDFGDIRGEARFEGLAPDSLDDLSTIMRQKDAVKFAGGRMEFRDDSIVARGLAMQARRMQVETEVFREQIASALPFMISFLGTPEFQREIVPVLQAFIRTPGALTIASEPAEPVSLSDLEGAIFLAPSSLPDMLAVTVTGDNGNDTGGGDLRPAITPDE